MIDRRLLGEKLFLLAFVLRLDINDYRAYAENQCRNRSIVENSGLSWNQKSNLNNKNKFKILKKFFDFPFQTLKFSLTIRRLLSYVNISKNSHAGFRKKRKEKSITINHKM